jgi:hypothetical protein
MILAAAIVIAGCGKEDLTDLQDTWVKKEGDVIAKLAEVQAKNQELHSKFETVKASNITDTAKLADRTMAETMLGDHDTQIADVEKTIASLKAKRDSVATNAKRADFEAAWKAAETEYDACLAKIASLSSQNGEIGSKIDGLAATTAAAPIDTVAGAAKPDSAATAVTAKDAKKPAEEASKVDEKKDDKKAAEAEKTEKKDDKKEVSK